MMDGMVAARTGGMAAAKLDEEAPTVAHLWRRPGAWAGKALEHAAQLLGYLNCRQNDSQPNPRQPLCAMSEERGSAIATASPFQPRLLLTREDLRSGWGNMGGFGRVRECSHPAARARHRRSNYLRMQLRAPTSPHLQQRPHPRPKSPLRRELKDHASDRPLHPCAQVQVPARGQAMNSRPWRTIY